MPYYTFKVYSTEKNVLTKQFSSRDCIDLHFLLANKDYEGVDLFCQKKYEEYTNDNTLLNSLDKFLYLFSQKILSHNFDTTVIHTYEASKTKITKTISLVKIYNDISECKFTLQSCYKEGNVKIEFGIPKKLSDIKNLNFYSISVEDKVFNNVDKYDCTDLSFLPVKLYRIIQNWQQENNKKIKSEYFKSSFIRELSFTNECFLYILDFIYNENVADFFDLSYTLSKDFGIDHNFIKNTTMRELYLLVDTININTKKKKNNE